MSKPRFPPIVEGGRRKAGWAGQWDRHRWPMPKAKAKARRAASRELRLMVWVGLLGGLLAFQGASLWSDTLPAGEIETPFEAPRGPIRMIDGDTFDYRGERIRIADIDTPEVRGRCDFEIRLASRATVRMRALLHAGPFELRPIAGRDEDRYGRKLRIVTREGRSLGDMLVAEGLARTWSGRREPWC